MDKAAIVRELKGRGWCVQEHLGSTFQLPPAIAARHPRLPESLVEFLSGLLACEDSTETRWFLCQCDYEGKSSSAFSWDEWEKLSLSAANGNPKEVAKVRAFWDCHFPFMLSVGSGYAFYAVCTMPDKWGWIVEGYGPDFEEVVPVAKSFEEFLTCVVREIVAPDKSLERTRER
jgi:hypothetical protein